MISETYDIGITYPWIRPPEELYGFNNIPFTTVNGLKLKFRGSREWFDYDFLIYGGENPEESITATGLDYLIELSMVGLELNIFIDNLKIRYSYHDAYKTFLDFSASLSDPTFASFATLYPGGIIESQSVFTTFGIKYDSERMLIIAEAGEREVEQSDTNLNWFVTFGYKLGKYLPHVTYSVANITESVAVGIDNEQKSLIIGVKRTLTPATSLKVEVAQSKIDKAGQDPFAVGLYDVFPTSGVTLDDEVNMINLAVNMVF